MSASQVMQASPSPSSSHRESPAMDVGEHDHSGDKTTHPPETSETEKEQCASESLEVSSSQETVMTESQETVMSESQDIVMSEARAQEEDASGSQQLGSISDQTPSSMNSVGNNNSCTVASLGESGSPGKFNCSSEESQPLLPNCQSTCPTSLKPNPEQQESEESQSLLGDESEKQSVDIAAEAATSSTPALPAVSGVTCGEQCNPGSSVEKVEVSQDPSQKRQDCDSQLSPNPQKKRRIHMDTQQCMDHIKTSTGAQALVNPATVVSSSKDPNRGLYPRRNLAKSFGNDFVSASSLNQVDLTGAGNSPQKNAASASGFEFKWTNAERKKPVPPSQKNSLMNYFPKSEGNASNSAETVKNSSDKPAAQSQSTQSATNDSKSSSTQTSGGGDAISVLMAGQKHRPNPPRRSSRGKGKKGNNQKASSQSSFSWKRACFGTIDLTEDCSSDDSLDEALSQSNTYGLVGEEMQNYRSPTKPKRVDTKPKMENEPVDYFSILPVHVIENIFSQLPMLDLCLNSNRVCTMWNDIISDSKFVPWKKMYHKLKKNVGETKQEIEDLMNKNGMAGPTDFLVGLVRYMKDFKLTTAKNMSTCLRQHPKYFWAEDVIKERIQDCIVNEEPVPWCVIALLVILSDSIVDVQNVTRCLFSPSSQCTAIEILECLYCIATFLLAFTLVRRNGVWHGIHYRVYYALYLHENTSIISLAQLQNTLTNYKGQQTIMRYNNANSGLKITHEQLRIVNHNVLPGEIIKIVAFAGTGKTTTLVRYTQLRPSLRFLLVVFNKSVQEHAVHQFPANVECRTAHSLAYQAVGKRYKFARKLNTYSLKVYTIAMNLPKEKGQNLFIRAKFALDTLQTFLASADQLITSAHAPVEKQDEKHGGKISLTHEEKMNYARDAEFIWKRMVDFNDKVFQMTHDGYLKLYQLSKPRLDEYDCILVDEAQDLTPAVGDIFLSQTQAKILVGDPRQQIYAFRGAVNAMAGVEATKIFYLTQSFRFGPEIAYVASCCMDTLHGEKEKTIVGNGNLGGVKGDTVGQVAVIARTNYHLFGEAVKRCCHCDDPIKVAFIGGVDGFGFSMLLDIHTLLRGSRQIQNNFIRRFESFTELEKYAEKTIDSELLGKIKIVKTYQLNLPSLISKIKSKCIKDSDLADMIFTTAHKAKGLEFSTVLLTDDFCALPQGSAVRQIMSIPEDEGNLLYVAVTRAKKRLLLTDTLLSLLKICGEKFDYPQHTKLLIKDDKPIKSFQTDAEIKPGPVCLVRSEVKKSNKTKVPGGVWSPELIRQDHMEFAQLLGTIEEHEEEKVVE